MNGKEVQSILKEIKRRRELTGTTQQQMADELGMSKANYCNIESGRTRVFADTLIIMCSMAHITKLSIGPE